MKVRVTTSKAQFEMNETGGQVEDQVEEETEIEGKEIVDGLDEDTQWHGEESKQVWQNLLLK